MEQALHLKDNYPGDILTPGRTDKKVIRGDNLEPNTKYRIKVGTLNWLCMGIRYDVVYTTKELSRVLTEPTRTANDILDRALIYIMRTKNAYLSYSHREMSEFHPPLTRKKPTDITDTYDVSYNTTDGIQHEDEKESKPTYKYNGPAMTVMCKTDCDLAGQLETRQTTTSMMIWVIRNASSFPLPPQANTLP
jgi:hypothetical protein